MRIFLGGKIIQRVDSCAEEYVIIFEEEKKFQTRLDRNETRESLKIEWRNAGPVIVWNRKRLLLEFWVKRLEIRPTWNLLTMVNMILFGWFKDRSLK